MIKFLLFLISGFSFVKSEYCNYDGEVHEIRTQNEVNILNNCTSFNGSLFINGEFKINNLKPLSNLKNISGYLLIWNTHNLTNLIGLHNLENINGDNLYLNNYFTYIVDNQNLCFVNTIDWVLLNKKNNYRTALNKNGCPSCNKLCNGCWNLELCHNCKYYKSGSTCVKQCPLGTDIEDNICIEFIPFPPENLKINSLNYTFKNITWIPPSYPNGIILGYNFYLDHKLIYTGLDTYYILSGLNLNQDYEIKINVFNLEGNSSNTSLILSIGNGLPKVPYNISYQIIDQLIKFDWFSDGTKYLYQIPDYNNKFLLTNNLILDDLNYYTNYSIRIKAYSIYGESNFSDWLNFTSYEHYPKIPNPPDLYLNNLNLNIKFNPKYPLNGRILNYNFNVYQNNNLYLNQSTNLDNINITTNYYKDYKVNYILSNNIGISKISNSSYITTDVGHPLKPTIPTLIFNRYLTVIINKESNINGPIIKYEILMFYFNNKTIIYSSQFPGNITLNNLNNDYTYDFQSKVFTSDTKYSVSEKISYNPVLENNINIFPWWIILIIVISIILLFIIIILLSSCYQKKHLNKISDKIILNKNRNSQLGKINPVYEPRLPPIRSAQDTIYNKNLNRIKTDSNYDYETERLGIYNSNYEQLHHPSNPPNIAVPKNMLKN